MNFGISGGIIGVKKLTNQTCSSEGYRVAENQTECEDIATRLFKRDRISEDHNNHDCINKTHYRCNYYNYRSAYWKHSLTWNPRCGDDRMHKYNDSLDEPENLCIQSGN